MAHGTICVVIGKQGKQPISDGTCIRTVSVRQRHLADTFDKGDVLHLKTGGHHRPYRQDFHAPKNFLSQTV